MSYPVTWKPAASSNFAVGRNGHVPGWIVNHRMVGYLTGTDRHFALSGVQVSTHFGIGHRTPGGSVEISQYVYLDDRAFGNGNNVDEQGREVASEWNRLGYPPRPNEHTVSIEHEDGGSSVDANGKRGVVDEDVIAASIWLNALLLSGDPEKVRGAGIRFRSEGMVLALGRIPRDARHVIDHHFIAGPLKPFCWQPWLDDKGFPQARYLAALAQQEDNPDMLPITDPAEKLVDIAVGKQLYDLNGQPKVKVSVAQNDRPSPFGTKVGSVAYRAVYVTTGGTLQLLLVKASDAVLQPVPAADCSAVQQKLDTATKSLADRTDRLARIKTLASV